MLEQKSYSIDGQLNKKVGVELIYRLVSSLPLEE